MSLFFSLLATASFFLVLPSVLAAFNPDATNNLLVYWNPPPVPDLDKRLADFCKNSEADIINIGFVTRLRNVLDGSEPEFWLNGPICHRPESTTPFDSFGPCPEVAEAVKYCQCLGRKIVVSASILTDADVLEAGQGAKAAEFMYKTFGPVSADWKGARPFGDVIIDGIDLNVEKAVSPPAESVAGFHEMMAQLRSVHLPTVPDRQISLSMTVGCDLTSPLLSVAQQVPLDILALRFWGFGATTCRARTQLDGGAPTNFDKWATTALPTTKLYFGLVGGRTFDPNNRDYLQYSEAHAITRQYLTAFPSRFSGVAVETPDYVAVDSASCPRGVFPEYRRLVDGVAANTPWDPTCAPPLPDSERCVFQPIAPTTTVSSATDAPTIITIPGIETGTLMLPKPTLLPRPRPNPWPLPMPPAWNDEHPQP